VRGGSRPNAGRKPGSTSAKTVERLKQVAQVMTAVEDAMPDAFHGDAHAFLIAVYKNPEIATKDRLAAATAAIGYEKPKLAAVEHSGDPANPVEMRASIEFVVVDSAQG
jgi:hypothetical protein